MKNKKDFKPSSWIETCNCAIEGILWAARSQRHMRIHFLSAVAVLLLACLFRVSALEFILLVFAVVLVLLAEMVNTAFEAIVDMVSPEYHPLAQKAKDVAAGAVLITCIGAVVIGYLALSGYVLGGLEKPLGTLGTAPSELSMVSVLAVVILVVLLKARFGKGTPLHGGMPSGHSAVAFSIATSVALSGIAPVLILLALAMAVMVSHSRLLLRIHSLREVLIGAGLGVTVTLAIHFLFA